MDLNNFMPSTPDSSNAKKMFEIFAVSLNDTTIQAALVIRDAKTANNEGKLLILV